MKIETRDFAAKLEVRAAAEGGRKHIVGHAAMFDSLSVDFGGWKERIAPGAFGRTLREGQDVVALFDHDTKELLGRRSSSTLNVYEDAHGLAFDIDPPDLEHARKVVMLIERGDLRGASFAFTTRKDAWNRIDGAYVRTLLDVDLYDVSPVTFPAYPATDVSMRGFEVARAGLAAAIASEPDGLTALRETEARARRTRLLEIELR
jgi:HK97 family phage prohead protease